MGRYDPVLCNAASAKTWCGFFGMHSEPVQDVERNQSDIIANDCLLGVDTQLWS